MKFGEAWKELKPIVDGWIEEMVGDLRPATREYFAEALREGKRVRPTLCVLHYQALGNRDIETVKADELLKRFAVSIEALHQGALIHDDFIDEHRKRRGRAALYLRLGPRRAVLLGDAFFGLSQRLVAGNDEARATMSEVVYLIALAAFSEPVAISARGLRALGRYLREGGLDSSFYMDIVAGKTAALFSGACRLGSIAAMASPEMRQVAHNYGMRFGQAFQMADDISDLKKGKTSLATLLPIFAHYKRELLPKPSIFALPLMPWALRNLAKDAPEIVGLMKEDVEKRAEEARAMIAPYPEGSYKEALLDAPGAVAEIMMAG